MKSTSRSSRPVSCAARSPALAITGPEVERKFTPSSRAHDLRQGSLSETRRADEQHVVERLASGARRLDEDPEVLARAASWPVKSTSVRGRTVVSASSSRFSGVMRRRGGRGASGVRGVAGRAGVIGCCGAKSDRSAMGRRATSMSRLDDRFDDMSLDDFEELLPDKPRDETWEADRWSRGQDDDRRPVGAPLHRPEHQFRAEPAPARQRIDMSRLHGIVPAQRRCDRLLASAGCHRPPVGPWAPGCDIAERPRRSSSMPRSTSPRSTCPSPLPRSTATCSSPEHESRPPRLRDRPPDRPFPLAADPQSLAEALRSARLLREDRRRAGGSRHLRGRPACGRLRRRQRHRAA